MAMQIIVSDFDGTITKKDSLYNFFDKYASKSWLDVEESWKEGKISSKECLIKEFELVEGLSEELIIDYIKDIELDEGFKDFIDFCYDFGMDFLVVSDGVDYFINKILQKNGIKYVKLITNHARFINGRFMLSFPNDFSDCKNDAGTCKCKVISDLRKNYNKIYYIGDGTSDLCVADKADILFAKDGLAEHCEEKKIKYTPYNSFKDIVSYLQQ